MPVIEGLTRYFKDLSVSGSLVNVVTGWRQKVRLFYADVDEPDISRSIELDATTEITVTLETDLLQTPAENQVVYTQGALLKPKQIQINCHLDVSKLTKLNILREALIPVYVMAEKNMAGIVTQVGYWSDSAKYGIKSITQLDNGYDNTVAVTILLEELRLFTYQKEYVYNTKQNKIPEKDKRADTVNAAGEIRPSYVEVVKDWGNRLKTIAKNIVGGG